MIKGSLPGTFVIFMLQTTFYPFSHYLWFLQHGDILHKIISGKKAQWVMWKAFPVISWFHINTSEIFVPGSPYPPTERVQSLASVWCQSPWCFVSDCLHMHMHTYSVQAHLIAQMKYFKDHTPFTLFNAGFITLKQLLGSGCQPLKAWRSARDILWSSALSKERSPLLIWYKMISCSHNLFFAYVTLLLQLNSMQVCTALPSDVKEAVGMHSPYRRKRLNWRAGSLFMQQGCNLSRSLACSMTW